LQLNPESLRKPSSYMSNDTITPEGENLAATLLLSEYLFRQIYKTKQVDYVY